jgi:DNA-binding SARP family transcriptional activator
MRYQLLGPVGVEHAGQAVPIGSHRVRLALATLLLHANRPVEGAVLVGTVWGDAVPVLPASGLRALLTRLRRVLEPDRRPGDPSVLTRHPAGWVLAVPDGALDAHRFEALAERSRQAQADDRPEQAARLAREALAEWRGPALADVVDDLDLARAPAQWWEELRLATVERAIESELALGRHDTLTGEIAALIAAHPFRERLVGLLMVALYRSGRQADALAVYHDARRRLADGLGLVPDDALVRLELAILDHAPAVDIGGSAGSCPGPPPVPVGTGPAMSRDDVLAVLERGDRDEADAALVAHRRRAYGDDPEGRWWADTVDAAVATARGELRAAEPLVLAAFERGWKLGAEDAGPIFAGQTFMLRWFQGRLDEIEVALEDMVRTEPENIAGLALRALASAEAGDGDAAQRRLEDVGTVLDRAPRDPYWLGSVVFAAEAAALVGAPAATLASRLLDLLRPHAGRHLVFWPGVALLGPCERYLGGLLAACGEQAAAVTALDRAERMAGAAGLVPYALMARLTRQSLAPGGDEAGRRRALAVAGELGLGIVASRPAPVAVCSH